MAVRDLGLLNAKDWTLLEKIRNEDWTLVTNNVDEFRRFHYANSFAMSAIGRKSRIGVSGSGKKLSRS